MDHFPTRFGKYILLDRINAGGMAEVFRAKVMGAEKFERLVAIKCMLPQLASDQSFIDMFIDEANIAVQLNHANIVQIYDLGRQGQRLYIAMELVNGRDLRHIVRTTRASFTPIPIGFAAYVVSKAAQGLDFAHRKTKVDGTPLNLVHRDVSPQNILVSYDGEVKVVDFGIAKAEARATETQAGVLKGKFAYMAPEQVRGSDIDHRADIFALGTVLFEIITGHRLFTGDNDLSVLEKVRSAQLPDLSQLLPEGSEELEQILRRALAKNARDRYAHASELAEALEHLLIEDRNIFGYKRAAQFMGTLYADEMVREAQDQQRYAAISVDNMTPAVDSDPFDEPNDTYVPVSVSDADFIDDNLNDPTPADGIQAPSSHGSRPRPVPSATAGRHGSHSGVRSGTGSSTRPASRHSRVGPVTQRQAAVQKKPRGAAPRIFWALMFSFGVLASLAALLVWRNHIDIPRVEGVVSQVEALNPKEALPKFFSLLNPNTLTSLLASPNETDDSAKDDVEDIDPKSHQHYGWVSIRCRDQGLHGHVFIDGKDAGALPLSPRRLRTGSHEVRFVDDSAEGRSRDQIYVVIVMPRHTRHAPKLLML